MSDSHVLRRVPDSFGNRVPPSDIPLYYASLRENLKLAKYGEKVRATGRQFAPYVVETGGGLGKLTKTFLTILRRNISENREKSRRLVLRFIQEQACLRIRAYSEQVNTVARACKGTPSTRGYDDTLDLDNEEADHLF